jgi:transcriptional regulator with XRE-family HTH domain
MIRVYLVTDVQELKRRRKAKGLSMKGLSECAGLPGNAVLRIESGSTKRINHLRAREIAKALNCEVSDIFKYNNCST